MEAVIEGIYRDGKIIPKEAFPWERPMRVVIVPTEPLESEGQDVGEEYGWLRLSEDSLKEVWGDPAEDAVWRKYLTGQVLSEMPLSAPLPPCDKPHGSTV